MEHLALVCASATHGTTPTRETYGVDTRHRRAQLLLTGDVTSYAGAGRTRVIDYHHLSRVILSPLVQTTCTPGAALSRYGLGVFTPDWTGGRLALFLSVDTVT